MKISEINKAKIRDMEIRADILEIMGVCLRIYKKTHTAQFLNDARDLGKVSESLKKKISTKDYSEEDKIISKIDKLLSTLTSCGSPQKKI